MQYAPAPQTPARHAPPAMWRVAEALLQMLHALFGAPEDVARMRTLRQQMHALLLSWLRTGEALMRRLLALEAAAHPRQSAPPRPSRKRQHERRTIAFVPDAPEQWRVSFRCFMDRRRPAGLQRPLPPRAPAVQTSLRSAWPLAKRYEALIRVFNDPSAAARRLARRLHEAPLRLAGMLRGPPEAGCRIDDFEALGKAAESAWKPCLNSS